MRNSPTLPKVSIGVPVYNGERFLRVALDSLLGQTFEDFELIISDNASTDATESICREYADRDTRVRYYRNSVNQGAAWNFNRVAELGRSEYFKWAMADDACEPEFVARCVAALDDDPTVVLSCSKTLFIDENGVPLETLDPGWNLESAAPFERLRAAIYAGGHWANADALQGVVRRSAWKRTRLMPRYQGGDKRPLAELSLIGRFHEIPEYMLLRRVHGASSGSNNPEFAKNRTESTDWMVEFFKASRFQILLPTWNLLADHIRIVAGSGLPLSHKIKLIGAVLKVGKWHRRYLINEVGRAFGAVRLPRWSQRLFANIVP